MIDFAHGGLIDIWPDKESPQIQALSYAMQQAMVRLKNYADQAMCYSDVDNLPEDILDYFAVEMRAMYYEQNLPIEQKREIVKNTLKWYTYAGTPETVAEMVAVIFGEGEVVEWFNYEDPPFTPGTFDIVTSARLTPDIIEKLESMIGMAKNVRSHIRGVVIVRDVHSDAHLAIHHVCVQECTVYNHLVVDDNEADQGIYAATLASTTRDCEARNDIHTDTNADSENAFAAYGSVYNTTCYATNDVVEESEAHSATTSAHIGSVYNTTSFIKEENG